jgi:hypothetical protein
MCPTRLKKITAAITAASCIAGISFSGCAAVLRVPTGELDVSDEGILIDFPGALVSVTHQRLTLDLVGIEVELKND